MVPHSKGEKRINEATGLPFKVGQIRKDGYVFDSYQLTRVVQKNGFFKEKWRSPESWSRTVIYRAERRKKIYDYVCNEINNDKLKAGGCKHCEYNDNPYALQYHHLDPTKKIKNVSGYYRTSFNQLRKMREEAKGCIVLCANCHLIEEQRIRNEN
mgnify:FL=1